MLALARRELTVVRRAAPDRSADARRSCSTRSVGGPTGRLAAAVEPAARRRTFRVPGGGPVISALIEDEPASSHSVE